MKGCPACGRLYPSEAAFCPVDGHGLTSASEAPLADEAGDKRLGYLIAERYELRRVVADGAMGRVYEALDRLDRQSVAVKILHTEVASNEVELERFRREFQVNQLLPHAHIVKVIDFSPTHDGSFALVMEFLYGEELSAALRRKGRLHPARVVRLLSQLALALDQAHSKKLVHRDLKPDNLFLCQTSEGDNVKILDFGSVKDKARSAKNLTVMGTTIGSPFYMAPEQAQGLPTLDHRADIWALAAIGFECITGRVPFVGQNGPTILINILQNEAPAPSSVVDQTAVPIPKSVDAAFARAFRKKPEYRPSSVGEFADEVGVAYGLRGTHADWARSSEQSLRERIDVALPGILERELDQSRDSVEDAFFADPQQRPRSASSRGAEQPAAKRGAASERTNSLQSDSGNESDTASLPVSSPWPILTVAVLAVLIGLSFLVWLVM